MKSKGNSVLKVPEMYLCEECLIELDNADDAVGHQQKTGHRFKRVKQETKEGA